MLKDAAATSIYGARAANGVIVITTKKGKSDKLDISAGAYWAVSSRVDLDYLFNMASAENQFRYVELMHGYNAIPSGSDPYSVITGLICRSLVVFFLKGIKEI